MITIDIQSDHPSDIQSDVQSNNQEQLVDLFFAAARIGNDEVIREF